MSLGLGYLLGTAIFAVAFALAVAAQIAARRFHPFLYWFTIITTTTVGTTLADYADRSLGIGYAGGSALLLALLIGSLLVWYRSLGSIAVDTVATPKAEAFYWITIMGGYTGRGGAGGFGAGGGGGASNTGGAGGFGGGNGGTIANGGGGAGLGGAIFNHNGRVTLVNSTLTGNLAQGGATNAVHDATTGSALGGAIFNLQGTLNVLHSTIALNVLEGANGAQSVDGGGIYNLALLAGDDGGLLPHEASAIVQNSILSNSVYFTSQGLSDLFNLQPPTVGDGAPNIASASVTVGAHNIVMLSGGVTTNASNADPVLAPLANNGGIAPTMALQNGSPAIDRGLGCVTNLPAFDQRGSGYPRVIRSAPDLGAYEYSGSGHGDTIFAYAFEVGC